VAPLVASIRGGILRLIADEDYREELIIRGFANAARFDATAVANRYAEIYEQLLAS
jgi:hypothetical protein